MARLILIPVLLIALLGGAVVWSDKGHSELADFAFINRGDNKTLDLNTMSFMQDIRLAYALWEGLYGLDPETLKPIPGTADKIEISPDRLVYTFHIRPNARWSNGDPVLANDFLFEWRRMLESPGEYTYLHHYIKGAEDYEDAWQKYTKARKEIVDPHQKEIDAIKNPEDRAKFIDRLPLPQPPDFSKMVGEASPGPATLVVTLTRPVPYFPSVLAFPPFFPLDERMMKQKNPDGTFAFARFDPATGNTTYDQSFTRPPNLITNGPYYLAERAFKLRVRLRANEYYWDASSVKSKIIDQVYCEEPLSAYRLYQQGDVDWLADVDGELAAAILKKGGRNDLHVFPAFGTYYYELNCQEKLPGGLPNPLRDVRVRQALSMAIDKDPIVRDVARMHQPIATTYIPPGVFAGYHSPPGLPFDIGRAQKLLADAGYPGGKGFPRLSILYNTEGNHQDIAVVIHRQWQQNLGIDVDLRGVEIKQFAPDLHSHNFSVSRASWYGDYDDPSTFTDKYLSDSDNNDAGWVNKQYDDLCAQAAAEPDPAKRLDIFSRAEDVLLNDAPIIPIYTAVGAYLVRDNVKGISFGARMTQMFQPVHVQRSGSAR